MEDAKVARQTGRMIMYEKRAKKKKRYDGLRNKESVTFGVDMVEIWDLVDADSYEEIPSK